MAKRRRPTPGSTRKQRRTPAAAAKRPTTRRARPAVAASSAPTDSRPKPRTTYPAAVALYERGVRALQRKRYPRAAELLQDVVDRFPEERELHERVRLYLKVCERHVEATPPPPSTPEDRVYAATLALNAGVFDQAIAQLSAVTRAEPDNDHAHYMLASAYALSGRTEPALTHLQRAIELNNGNRALARQDPDLDSLRTQDAFRRALEQRPRPPAGRRPRARRPRT